MVSLVFPAQCELCGAALRHPGRIPVCAACLAEPQSLDAAQTCPRCGKSAPGAQTICLECQIEPPAYASAGSFTSHDGAGRELIHLLKYGGIRPLAAWWAERMWPLALKCEVPADCVVAVPLTPERLRQRGFNPSALVAQKLAGHLALPWLSEALRRPAPAIPQAGLDVAQRIRNVVGAFRAAGAVNGRRVLLVDDVLTTGATARSAAGALLSAGALRVDLITATRADLHGSDWVPAAPLRARGMA